MDKLSLKKEYIMRLLKAQANSDRLNSLAQERLEKDLSLTTDELIEQSQSMDKLCLELMQLRKACSYD